VVYHRSERRGIELKTGVVGRRAKGALVLERGGERLDVERVLAVPRLVGPAIQGVPHDHESFILAGDDALVTCSRASRR
jgi:hypothetical protein